MAHIKKSAYCYDSCYLGGKSRITLVMEDVYKDACGCKKANTDDDAYKR